MKFEDAFMLPAADVVKRARAGDYRHLIEHLRAHRKVTPAMCELLADIVHDTAREKAKKDFDLRLIYRQAIETIKDCLKGVGDPEGVAEYQALAKKHGLQDWPLTEAATMIFSIESGRKLSPRMVSNRMYESPTRKHRKKTPPERG